MSDESLQIVAAHRDAGQFFEAGGLRGFMRVEGSGPTVVCMHGLPASSFLYRKVIPELAARGFRALCFDLPGLGLTDRPTDFTYTIRNLGVWAGAAVDALGIDEFHLVLHDAGGPVGLEMALPRTARIRSLTVLDTVVELTSMPFGAEIYARFARRLSGPMASPRLWRELMYRVGVLDRDAVPDAELDAYRDLCLGSDGGAGYLNLMRDLRKEPFPIEHWAPVLDARTAAYPVQVVWGAKDRALPLGRYGTKALEATHLPSLTVVPARHFLQEDQAPVVADLIARLARTGG